VPDSTTRTPATDMLYNTANGQKIATSQQPRVGFGAHVCYHCRISPPRFLAKCRKRRANQGSFVLLFFRLFALSDLYLVFACLFSCAALFVSISQVIGCEDSLRNDLLCVGGALNSTHSLTHPPHPNILTCRDVGLWHCDVANLLYNKLQNCCELVRWCCCT